MTESIIEGTWEEISRRGPEFAGRRLRVIVLADELGPESEGSSLDQALAGLIGVADSRESNLGAVSRL